MKSKSEIIKQIGSEDDLYGSSFDIMGYLKHLSHKWTAVVVFFI